LYSIVLYSSVVLYCISSWWSL